MNTFFNINRLGMLLKRFFLENRQRELTFWGLATLAFIYMHLSYPIVNSDKTSIEVILIFISGFIFAARMFKIFNYTPGGMHYLLIPATHLEKLITAILLSTVYFIAMIVITHVIGTTLGTIMGNLYSGTNNPICFELIHPTSEYSWYKQMEMTPFNTIFLFAAFQSLFLLGSIYFKGNAFVKTTLAIIVAVFLLFHIHSILVEMIIKTSGYTYQSHIKYMALQFDMFSEKNISFTIIKYAFIPFFWIVSYFRLTEKQV